MERPALFIPFGPKIVPQADYNVTGFTNGRITSGNKVTTIEKFKGNVYDMPMVDDTDSYYLGCVGQTGPSGQLLLIGNANACPTVAPTNGSDFSVAWDGSF